MPKISVIIPLAKNETAHEHLLAFLPDDFEVILSKEEGRAASLNAGAARASGDYLWFLHADSMLDADAFAALFKSIDKYPDSLLYFDLAFTRDAMPFMFLNQLGVYVRSRLLKVPFGDQGFCISADLFHKIGGFPEGLSYGEDHVFVWRVRQAEIKLHNVGKKIYTSARKYKQNGWFRTTFLHQYLWIKQAWPEWRKLKKRRMS